MSLRDEVGALQVASRLAERMYLHNISLDLVAVVSNLPSPDWKVYSGPSGFDS